MSRFFLSCVSNEFKSYRQAIANDLQMPGVEVEIQESFIAYGDRTLLMLNDYVKSCDAVIHLAGDQSGSVASVANREAILELYSYEQLQQQLGLNQDVVNSLSYTQWEAWLAVLHRRKLYICTPTNDAKRDNVITDEHVANQQRQSQVQHMDCLRACGRYAEASLNFHSPERLSIALLRALKLESLVPAAVIPGYEMLPPSIGKLFKGREDLLDSLRQQLLPRAGSHFDARRVALWGNGGVGKTRLAVEYAHTFGHQHSALLAVTATSPGELQSSIADLAGCLGLDQKDSTEIEVRYKAALDWLGDPQHRNWFLLIDNVDDDASFAAAEALIRKLRHGHVVITTRLRQWPDYVTDLHLEVLDRKAATEYLLEATAGKRQPEADGSDSLRAAELASLLGYLALALVQAKAAILRHPLSFSDYITNWQKNHEQVLEDPDYNPVLTGYPRTVASTWQTSYRQLPPGSALLFDALCWISSDPIPDRLIKQPWSEQALNVVPDSLRATVKVGGQRLVQSLYDYCLVDPPLNNARTLTIHRLVQDVGRIWQRKAGTAARAQGLIAALVETDFIRDGIDHLTLHILPQLRQLMPHVFALLKSVESVPQILRCKLHRVVADAHWHEGLTAMALSHAKQAVVAGEAACEQCPEQLPAEHALAEAICLLVFVLTERGDITAASHYGQRLMAFTNGWDVSSTLKRTEIRATALSEVGRIREKKGEQDAALQLFDQSRAISEDLCKREPDNLAHRRELGIALENVGRIREKKGEQDAALQLFDQSRAIREDLCKREPDNLAHRRDLGIALENVGRIREKKGEQDAALQLFDQSRAISEDLCKREPDNLAHRRDLGIALNNVGRIREKKGEQDAALQLFDQSRAISEDLCKREPDNLAHRRELGITCYYCGRSMRLLGLYSGAVGRLEGAEKIFQELIATAAFADSHSNLAVVQRELSLARRA